MEAPGQRPQCALPRRSSFGLAEFQDLRGVAEALAARGHERCLVVVACAIAVMPAPRPAASPPANSKPAIRRMLIRSLSWMSYAVHPLSPIALQPR
jgi:hypothetical protein